MDFSFTQQDAIIFAVAFGVVYIGLNVYNKENDKEPDYTRSFQYALLCALLSMIASMTYSQNSKGELKLDEPFNS